MREQPFAAAIGDWSLPMPHRRFGIYRNNVVAALVNALRVRFPVTEQLVGPEFFAAMAGSFANANRPASPILIAYGADFPEFIGHFPPAASVPYLSDVARLECAWWDAYHAADSAPLSPEVMAAVSGERWRDARFQFHPALGLVASPFAIGSIWQAHHGGPGMSGLRLNAGEYVLVSRPQAKVLLRTIPASSHALIDGLGGGATLGDAIEQLSECHPDFDLAAELRRLITLNIITGIDL